MDNVFQAVETFFAHFRDVAWLPVLFGLLCHSAKMLVRTRAWRNVLAAAYPDTVVRWPSVFGAYAAGAGVNAVVPVRGGDLLNLYLVRRRIAGSSYPTLASSLLVPTIVDLTLSSLLLAWALGTHVLPGVRLVRRLPEIDWSWLFRHPRLALTVLVVAVVASFLAGVLAAGRIAAFRQRVAQGLAILHTPSRYLGGVVTWQLVDWALRIATIYFFLHAFHIPATLDNALRVQVTQSLATILPLTPSGIGTKQALLVYVLHGQETRTALLSYSVGMELVLTAWNALLGAAALAVMLRTLHWRRQLAGDSALTPTPDAVSAQTALAATHALADGVETQSAETAAEPDGDQPGARRRSR
jgi:glycosyltransferase 2 family protein